MFLETKKEGEAPEKDLPHQFLLDAANYMDRHGWCQGFMSLPGGAVCLLGAINRAAEPYAQEIVSEGVKILKRTIQTDCIPDWNDRVCRSKKQAVAALRKAAG